MSVQTTRMPWIIRRGEPFVLILQAIDDAGSAIDITGYTITADIRTARTYAGGSSVDAPTVDFVDAANGYYRVKLTDTETAALTAQQFAGWGMVWMTGAATDNDPLLVVDAHPVTII